MRTNAPEEFHHEVDGGASALLGSFVGEGPAVVSSRSSFSLVSRDEEYELGTRGGTATFLNFFGWSKPPPKKFNKVEVPPLVPSSYSSSRDTDENEDLDDTAAGPTTINDPNNADAPPSTS